MNSASLATTLFAIVMGIWVHNTYLKKQPIWYVVGGTILFGEIFKWVTGIETIPLKISQKVLDKTSQDLETNQIA
jgi:hypothetical protein